MRQGISTTGRIMAGAGRRPASGPRVSAIGAWRTIARRWAAALLVSASLAAAVSVTAWAIDAEQAFDDPQMHQRYRALIREVRCLVCQNEAIADSNAPLAADLRREIRNLMEAGASDREITDFLVARYGDFVLFRPPVQPTTWVLWGAPFVLLAVGAVVFVRVLRNRGTQSFDDDEPFHGDDSEGGYDTETKRP